MKRKAPRFALDPESRLQKFLETEALRRTAILARARREAQACLIDAPSEAEPMYLFSEDSYFRH